jgi:hypothetical protein
MKEIELKMLKRELALENPVKQRSRTIFSFPTFALFMNAAPRFRWRFWKLQKTKQSKLWIIFVTLGWFTLGIKL